MVCFCLPHSRLQAHALFVPYCWTSNTNLISGNRFLAVRCVLDRMTFTCISHSLTPIALFRFPMLFEYCIFPKQRAPPVNCAGANIPVILSFTISLRASCAFFSGAWNWDIYVLGDTFSPLSHNLLVRFYWQALRVVHIPHAPSSTVVRLNLGSVYLFLYCPQLPRHTSRYGHCSLWIGDTVPMKVLRGYIRSVQSFAVMDYFPFYGTFYLVLFPVPFFPDILVYCFYGLGTSSFPFTTNRCHPVCCSFKVRASNCPLSVSLHLHCTGSHSQHELLVYFPFR